MTTLEQRLKSVREQILADQAERAAGENHTARTVAAWARHVPEALTVLSAAQQRGLYGPGRAVFGRRAVRHEPRRGGFVVRRIVAYGQDWHDAFFSYAEVAQLLNRGGTVVGQKD